MPVDDKTVSCGECKFPLEEDPHIPSKERTPCPKCGSLTRLFHVSIHDTITIKSKLGMKARHPGVDKPYIEEISGDDLQQKTGKWMKLARVVDRENDRYQETVTDPSSGEIVHQCEEPLSKHKGHGAAKYKKRKTDG